MLIQHAPKMTRQSRFVNAALTIVALTGVSTISSVSAHAYSTDVVKTEHSVKFKISEIETPTGLKTVYKKLSKKAAKACSFGSNIGTDGEFISKSTCADSLLTQFVKNASVKDLTRYHETQMKMKQSASLK